MIQRPSGRWSSIVPCVLLFAASFSVLLLCMNREVGLYDEGIILFGAARVADGDVLHRDFYANYGPGQFYILAFLFKLFSPSVLVERLWDTVARSTSVVLVFLIVARAGSGLAPWFAALASLVWLASFGFEGYPVFPALAAALASLLCLMPAFGDRWSVPPLLAAGLCTGLAALFRYDVGFLVFVAEALVLGLCAISQAGDARRRLRNLIRAMLPFGAGLGLVTLPVAAAYVAAGVLGDFVFDILIYPTQSYARMRSLPFPMLSALLAIPSAASVYLPVLACAAAVPAIFALARRRGQDESALRLWALLALAALTLAFFAKGYVRVSPIHMLMAIVSSVALVAVLASRRVRGGGTPARLGVAIGIAGTTVWTLGGFYGAIAAANANVAWLAQGSLCHTPAGLERLACFTVDQSHVDAIRYIQQETKPGEAIFVGLGRHDKIFMNDVGFYFLAGRRSATKWHHMDPGLQTTAPIQREMVAELGSKRPRFVVLESEWDGVEEPNASALSSGVTILDDYIRARFTPVATFGTVTVLQDQGPRASP